MKSAIKALFICVPVLALTLPVAADMRSTLLRQYAVKSGLVPPSQLTQDLSPVKSSVGKRLFEDTSLSLNGDTSCKTCHLDEFSSADGLPNAVGVLGKGKGAERLRSKGDIVPRNTLPLWGRGAPGFNVFFWDGKVHGGGNSLVSQFGSAAPSDDPLTVAVHLPFVEIREMLVDDRAVLKSIQNEDVQSAQFVYSQLAERIRANDDIAMPLASAFQIDRDKIVFGHIAESVATFIRDKFRLRETRFHRFVFGEGELSDDERAGGLIFYGKGRCSLCHNGPFFSDLEFHAIPFPQVGFGKNGFGIDYGRYNVTFDTRDTYKFRTPPLFNVTKTAPYSHSGSVNDLSEAIRYHFDPLRHFDLDSATMIERTEFYARLKAWASDGPQPNVLTDDEVEQIVAFLKTLSF